ncbi:unnamed protein product [Pleuronectes platessa]|uniref:Uncharacterized protein n=1 Tax=Pleuronectes platessa TaxID=8262 RepID=A0A9N7VNQ7_PLEPL|nr:unnamed protein product [Pleuronectes platessa]
MKRSIRSIEEKKTLVKRQLDAGITALKETRVALAEETIALRKELFAKNKALMEQLEEKAALGAEIAALRKQAVYNISLVEENSVLKKKLFAKNKALMEQLEEKAALGAEIAALRKQAVYNVPLVEENSILEKKLDAENTGIKDHVAEKAILENLAAENAALAADRNALKKEIVKSVDTARAREEELEKKVEDLKTMIKVTEEENFCLSANLQLQDLDEVLVEHEWQAKFEDLQETYEEKLRCSVLEQRLALTTKEYREKVKKETKEKKKQEKKEQQEREKKEKEERMTVKKREKEEKKKKKLILLIAIHLQRSGSRYTLGLQCKDHDAARLKVKNKESTRPLCGELDRKVVIVAVYVPPVMPSGSMVRVHTDRQAGGLVTD